MQPSVEYLGYLIDAEGIHTTPEKVAANCECSRAQKHDRTTVLSGLSKLLRQVYQEFIKYRSPAEQTPLQGRKVEVFQELKAKLKSSEVLVHYDEKLPLKLDCDASAYDIGAVLSHVYPDGSKRPIAYASHSLTSAEVNYAQIEKEGSALIYGVK